MFDFPASPTVGQTYTLNGVSYTWNGYAWMQSAQSPQSLLGAIVEASNNHIIYQAPNDPNLRIMEQWATSSVADGAGVAFSKPFKTAPVVTVVPTDAIPATAGLMFSISTVGTGSFIIHKRFLTWAAGGTTGYNAGVATQNFNWRAIGVAP